MDILKGKKSFIEIANFNIQGVGPMFWYQDGARMVIVIKCLLHLKDLFNFDDIV